MYEHCDDAVSQNISYYLQLVKKTYPATSQFNVDLYFFVLFALKVNTFDKGFIFLFSAPNITWLTMNYRLII